MLKELLRKISTAGHYSSNILWVSSKTSIDTYAIHVLYPQDTCVSASLDGLGLTVGQMSTNAMPVPASTTGPV